MIYKHTRIITIKQSVAVQAADLRLSLDNLSLTG